MISKENELRAVNTNADLFENQTRYITIVNKDVLIDGFILRH